MRKHVFDLAGVLATSLGREDGKYHPILPASMICSLIISPKMASFGKLFELNNTLRFSFVLTLAKLFHFLIHSRQVQVCDVSSIHEIDYKITSFRRQQIIKWQFSRDPQNQDLQASNIPRSECKQTHTR
jgi:hypothetical protein